MSYRGIGRNPFGAGGASPIEMRIFEPGSDGRAERLLDDPGSVYPGEADFETASFLCALRAAVPVPPDPALEAEMIPALAGAARTATLEAARAVTGTIESAPATTRSAPRWRLRVAALAAVVAALPLLMTGLAFAGVDLPDAVDDAFETVGIDLPNQAASDESATAPGRGDAKRDENARKAAAGKGSSESNSQDEPAQSSKGKANKGKAKGKPEHAGQEAPPPGEDGTPPGQGGVVPGTGDETPSPAPAAPPATPPGHGGVPPGQGGVPPGQATK